MNVENQLYDIIRRNISVIYENVNITDETELIRDLGFDSITIIQLILDVEESFNIEFDDEAEYEDISVIKNLKKYIIRKTQIKEND